MIRNYKGHVFGTLHAARPYNSNPFVAESIALFMAVQLSRDLGLHSIQIKGDALHVFRLLKHNDQDWSVGGLLIKDAFQLINSFANWLVHHVNWERNSIAHCLVIDVLLCIDDIFEYEEILLCIVNVVKHDTGQVNLYKSCSLSLKEKDIQQVI